MMKKIWKLIYDVKYTQKKKVIRILCFKFKFSNKTPMKFMPYIPNITHIGKCSYSGQDIYITNKEETIIGSFTSIGTGVSLGCGRHPINFLSTSPTYMLIIWDIKKRWHLTMNMLNIALL